MSAFLPLGHKICATKWYVCLIPYRILCPDIILGIWEVLKRIHSELINWMLLIERMNAPIHSSYSHFPPTPQQPGSAVFQNNPQQRDQIWVVSASSLSRESLNQCEAMNKLLPWASRSLQVMLTCKRAPAAPSVTLGISAAPGGRKKRGHGVCALSLPFSDETRGRWEKNPLYPCLERWFWGTSNRNTSATSFSALLPNPRPSLL